MNPDQHPDLTIVLLGKTGVGKSASGNTILGESVFESRVSYKVVTTEISEQTGNVFGKQILVVDTPGILDTKDTEKKIKHLCQDLLKSGRQCLFLVVIRVGRFTEEDQKAVTAAMRVVGTEGMKKSYLLFTGGDALKDSSLEGFIFEDEDGTLPHVVRRFAGAHHLFNNETDDEEQVRKLLLKTRHLRSQDRHVSTADVSKDRRMLLLGRPHVGKSSSGNTILRSKVFGSVAGFNPVTTETVSKSATVEGRQVTVVDSPGITDEDLTYEELYLELMKSIVEASPGLHAFIIVVKLDRITEADIKLFELLPKLFDKEACRYSMVLFTHGDKLQGRSIDDLIKSNTHVSKLVTLCGGRYCVFDNQTQRSREQVRNLLNEIDEMVRANGGNHYTNEMFKMAETFRKEETNLLGQSGSSDSWFTKVWRKVKPYVIFFGLVCGGAVIGAAIGAVVAAGMGAGIGLGTLSGIGAGAGVGALAGAGAVAVAGKGAGAGAVAVAGAGAGGVAVAIAVAGAGAHKKAGKEAGKELLMRAIKESANRFI